MPVLGGLWIPDISGRRSSSQVLVNSPETRVPFKSQTPLLQVDILETPRERVRTLHASVSRSIGSGIRIGPDPMEGLSKSRVLHVHVEVQSIVAEMSTRGINARRIVPG